MAKLKFYPIGNADSTLILFSDERLMLKDYCHRKEAENEDDKRIDLPTELKNELDLHDRNDFDVVAFSHCDDDHVAASEDFFWLEHAEKYQDKDRPKIKCIWVPACLILENGLVGSAKVIREEARYRLKNGTGIRVFGNPGVLDDWLKEQGIKPEDRSHLISHAGTCVPGFSKDNGKAEIFIHSPFSFRMEDEEVERNNACLVFHITFYEGDSLTKVMQGSDAEHEAWCNIIYKTEKKKREERLDWDIFRVSHHCSHTALSDEKGDDITTPDEPIERLFGRGTKGCILISSSDPIPGKDTKQPPHKQAAAYYRKVIKDRQGEDFIVTMQTPNEDAPKPIVIEVTKQGAIYRKITGVAVGAPAIVSAATPRQG
ncbi:MAG: ComEC/Rec2 family competence protein [Sedimentisphaerales bacterium]